MVTESDAVLATIVDNWGGGGYGGATPKIQSTADISVDRWAALDSVTVLHDTLDELHPPVNDKYVNKEYTLDIRVTSITSEDQLKLLVEETEYLLNNTAITGFTSVRVTRKNRGSSDRGRKVYRNDITIMLKALLSSSAIAPAGGTTGDATVNNLIVNNDLDVGGELVMDGAVMHGTGSDFHMHPSTGNVPMNLLLHPLGTEDETALKLRTSTSANYGEFKVKVDGTTASIESNQGGSGTTPDTLNIDDAGWDTINIGDSSAAVTVAGGYNIAEAEMLGSANAVWVPMNYAGIATGTDTRMYIAGMWYANQGANDDQMIFDFGLPLIKGALKLHVSGIRLHLAAAGVADYIDLVLFRAIDRAGDLTLLSDGTNRTAPDDYPYLFAAVDVSAYETLRARLYFVVGTAALLQLSSVEVQCYYDT